MSNFFVNHYLKHSLRHEITELYASVAIKNFAFSMIAIFEPIYLYKIYGSISIVFLYYAVIYTLYFFLVPLGAKAVARYGFEHCIFYSIPFAIAYFLSLSQLPNYGWLIFVAIPFVIIYKSLFWPAYHTDFAHYSAAGYRGRELSTMASILMIATIAGPIVGGIILTKFGFETLFIIVSIISLVSAIPLFATKEKFEPHDFSCRKAFKRIISPYERYKRKNSIAYFAYGEELISCVGWPIFIFLILKEFYLLGILFGAATLLLSIINLYAGKLSDNFSKIKKKKILVSCSFLRLVLWFLRPFAASWLGIFLIDFLSKTSKVGITYPIFSIIYNGGGRRRDFLEYTMFYELSISLGKLSIAWIVFFISLYLTGFYFWFAIFALAGLWTLLYRSAKL